MILEAVEPVEVSPHARREIQRRFRVIHPSRRFGELADVARARKGADGATAQAPAQRLVKLADLCKNP